MRNPFSIIAFYNVAQKTEEKSLIARQLAISDYRLISFLCFIGKDINSFAKMNFTEVQRIQYNEDTDPLDIDQIIEGNKIKPQYLNQLKKFNKSTLCGIFCLHRGQLPQCLKNIAGDSYEQYPEAAAFIKQVHAESPRDPGNRQGLEKVEVKEPEEMVLPEIVLSNGKSEIDEGNTDFPNVAEKIVHQPNKRQKVTYKADEFRINSAPENTSVRNTFFLYQQQPSTNNTVETKETKQYQLRTKPFDRREFTAFSSEVVMLDTMYLEFQTHFNNLNTLETFVDIQKWSLELTQILAPVIPTDESWNEPFMKFLTYALPENYLESYDKLTSIFMLHQMLENSTCIQALYLAMTDRVNIDQQNNLGVPSAYKPL